MTMSLESIVANMSVADLARLAGTSVEQIVVAAMGGSSRPRAAIKNGGRAAKTQAPRAAKKGGSVARGGVSTDSLLQVVSGARGPIDINSIRAKIGGSPAQVRAGLQKLAAAKKVKITGKKRGTRYTAV
jgi:hypothetical protein